MLLFRADFFKPATVLLLLAAVLSACDKEPAAKSTAEKTTAEKTTAEKTTAEAPMAVETNEQAKNIELTPMQIHQSLVTLDTHIDISTALGTPDADPREDGPMQVDLPKMRAGGLDAGFFIVYVGQGPLDASGYSEAYAEAERKFTAIERMLANSPDDIVLATSPEQLKQAVAEGKLVAAIGVENAYSLGPNYEHLQEFYQRGARYISLTHFGHNEFGDSSSAKGEQNGVAEPVNHGLSEIGLALIEKMNALGIMVDVSHTSKESTLAALAHSKTPVIASHSGVKHHYDHPRNLSDEELRAIAAKGGVVQVVAYDSYMREVGADNQAAVADIRQRMGLTAEDWYKTVSQESMREFRQAVAELNDRFPRASVSDLVDEIDYIINLVGIDHVGIASDFGGGGGIQGWDDIGQTPAITAELLTRGYTPEQIEQIWSGNLLRVWAAVEEFAHSKHS